MKKYLTSVYAKIATVVTKISTINQTEPKRKKKEKKTKKQKLDIHVKLEFYKQQMYTNR